MGKKRYTIKGLFDVDITNPKSLLHPPRVFKNDCDFQIFGICSNCSSCMDIIYSIDRRKYRAAILEAALIEAEKFIDMLPKDMYCEIINGTSFISTAYIDDEYPDELIFAVDINRDWLSKNTALLAIDLIDGVISPEDYYHRERGLVQRFFDSYFVYARFFLNPTFAIFNYLNKNYSLDDFYDPNSIENSCKNWR